MRYYKLFLVTFLSVFLFEKSFSQIPTKCFEIKSILVDACSPGNLEGENEQMLIKIGPSNIPVSRLSVTWPNAAFKGFCQSSNTALKVDSLNKTIKSCGWLIEPVNGILPAGKDVLIITSDNMNVAYNSFTNLSDTLVILFQCVGSPTGYFVNYASSSTIRSVVITDTTTGCKDSVAYDASKLININGTFGGTSAQKDGGAVSYDFAGNPTYFNNGCQAAINVPKVFAGNDTSYCKTPNVISLNGSSNYIKSVKWSTINGLGTFTRNDTVKTTYNASASDVYPLTFILKGNLTCNDSIFDTLVVNRYINTIEAGVNTSICKGDSTQLNATGALTYNWSPSAGLSCTNCSNPFAKPTTSTQYILTGTYGVGCTANDSLTIGVNNKDSFSLSKDTSICRGSSVQLNISGVPSVLFSPTVALSCSTCTAPIASPIVSTTYTATSLGICPISKTVSILVDTAIYTAVNLSACGSVTYKNKLYTTSTSFNDTLKNKRGCDSIFTAVSITISYVNRDTVKHCILAGETYFAEGKNQSIAGLYTDTIKNTTGGCDTARVTDLKVVTPIVNITRLDSCFTATFKGVTVTKDTSFREVTLTTSLGCDTLIDSTVISIRKPSVKITSSESLPIVIGDSTQLTISPSNYQTIVWSPNQNISSINSNSPFVKPITDTKYFVLVTDNFGCEAVDSITVTVKEPLKEFKYAVPNAFSPNGDNKNEFFAPILSGNGEIVSFKIYNRWGELVFEQEGAGTGWDGNTKGTKQPAEVYIYYLVFKNNNTNKNEYKQGTLTLIR